MFQYPSTHVGQVLVISYWFRQHHSWNDSLQTVLFLGKI